MWLGHTSTQWPRCRALEREALRAARGDFVAPYVTPNGAGAAARVSF